MAVVAQRPAGTPATVAGLRRPAGARGSAQLPARAQVPTWSSSSSPVASSACRAVLATAASAGAAAACRARSGRQLCLGSFVRHRSARAAAEKEADDTGEQPLWSLDSPRVQLLAVLVLIFIANQACRALPFYLVDFGSGASPELAMNAALGFSSAEYGFYATLGFTVPFTLASLVAGTLADRTDRVRIIGVAGVLWSLLTAGMAFASSYGLLLGDRGLMAVSQAVTNPAALSLIADLFPEARATANAIFGLGIYVGGGVASLGAAIDEGLGWRGTCLAFGVVSLLASFLALFGAGDPQRAAESSRGAGAAGTAGSGDASVDAQGVGEAKDPVASVGDFLSGTFEAVSPAPARWLLVASLFRFCAGFAILVWLPPVVRGRFPGDVESFAFYNSLIKAVAGGASSLSGGVAADMLRARGLGDRAGAAFSAFSSLAAAPLWFMVLSPDLSFQGCMGFLLLEYLVAESWLGPAVAALQTSVPPERRGTAQGVFSALTALGNALPAALGLLAPDDLPFGFQASVAVCYVASAACFAGAAASLPSGGDEKP